jgi:phenylpyruvate tautomerase PptA (4-oxalocrotonate tautomerase family)
MTNYIATVKIKIDPQAHIEAKYEEYKKSQEAGKSATEADLIPPTDPEIKKYVTKVLLDRLSLDKEITHVSIVEVSPEDEAKNE